MTTSTRPSATSRKLALSPTQEALLLRLSTDHPGLTWEFMMSYFITKDTQDRVFLEHITPSERQKWPAVLVNGHLKRGETLPCDAGRLDGDAVINWSLDGTAMVRVPAMAPSVAQEPPHVARVDLPSHEEG